MLLVNGSTVYLRDVKTSEWIDSIAFDSLIVNLHEIGVDSNNKAFCITETSIKTMTLRSDGGEMSVEEVLQLPGKAVKSQLCEKTWNNSNLLIMIRDDGGLCLWSLT